MIDRFIALVKDNGLARVNHYHVSLNFPNTDTPGRELTEYLCESVNLPGMNIATTAQRVFGEVREIPYERGFDPVSMTFYVDGNMEVKAAFERWMHLIQNQTSRTMSYYNDYVREVKISVSNFDNKTPYDVLVLGNKEPVKPNWGMGKVKATPYTITLHEAYPKTMQSVTLDNGRSEFMRVTVQFQYRYWTSSLSSKVNNTMNIVTDSDPQGTSTSTGGQYKSSKTGT